MTFLQGIKTAVQDRRFSHVDHFSVENIGSGFYVYAHSGKTGTIKRKIGRYNSYEEAKKAVDTVLDLRFDSQKF